MVVSFCSRIVGSTIPKQDSRIGHAGFVLFFLGGDSNLPMDINFAAEL